MLMLTQEHFRVDRPAVLPLPLPASMTFPPRFRIALYQPFKHTLPLQICQTENRGKARKKVL
jgi:hypothetical protein